MEFIFQEEDYGNKKQTKHMPGGNKFNGKK
jgi:hypothetical protein